LNIPHAKDLIEGDGFVGKNLIDIIIKRQYTTHMLDQVIEKLKPVEELLSESFANRRALLEGLTSVFSNITGTWTPQDEEAILATFSNSMRHAHLRTHEGNWLRSMHILFVDESRKLHGYLKGYIGVYRNEGDIGDNFIALTLQKLMRAETNLPIVIANYEALGAAANPDVARELEFYKTQVLPAISRAIVEIKELVRGSLDLAYVQKEAERIRFEGIDTMQARLTEDLFPRQ
jgi:hypothetical protein